MSHHREAFRIRHDECDAYGHLNNAHYLRYMQEAAFAASAAAGLRPADYESLGRVWLIRATTLDYLLPLSAWDEIEVETWIEGIRGARSRRRYVFHKLDSGAVAAQGFSDWAYLNRSTGAPIPVEPEVVAAFFPEGDPPRYPRRRKLQPSSQAQDVFRWRRRVEWRDIDPMHHLNNAAYLSYAEECAIELARAYGWPFERWLEAGLAFVARQNSVEYLTPARFEDEIMIETWLLSMEGVSGIRFYRFRRASDETLLARMQTRWVLVDLQTGQPRRLPPGFRKRIAPNLAPS